MPSLAIRRTVCVPVATVALLGTFIGAGAPTLADSGNKCTSTANTSTCINIRGNSNVVDWIAATHHNNHPSGSGKFELTGPGGLDKWSPLLPYAGGNNAQYQWNEGGRAMLEGRYCVQWFVHGDKGKPETGMACATVKR